MSLISKLVEYSTLSCKWKSNLYHVSFSFRKTHVGNRNLIIKGRAFTSGVYNNEKVVVKILMKDAGETRGTYMKRFKEVNNMLEKLGDSNRHIRMNFEFVEPACAYIDERAYLGKLFTKEHITKDDRVVFEERLNGKFSQFVSDDGTLEEINETTKMINAFCHFSFFESGGKLVVCGLKGIKVKSNGVSFLRLTNPTIHSRRREFGSKDMGDEGIRLFLSNHVCNELCYQLIPRIPTAPPQYQTEESPPPYSSEEPPPPYQQEPPPPYSPTAIR